MIRVGDRVEAGERGTEDHDTGRVITIRRGMATIGWDSCVQTCIEVSELRPEGEDETRETVTLSVPSWAVVL